MHLLDIEDLSSSQIHELFDLTDKLRIHQDRNQLRDRTFILFFPESSLRTRITFEKGIQVLGGSSIVFSPNVLDKREQLSDVNQYIENWADGVIVRHANYPIVEELSRHASIPVINAMTSMNHPCEILSDLYSIRRMKENYEELVYTFVGPAGNIARSWKSAAKVLNLHFNHVCTAGDELGENSCNYHFHTELAEVLMESDVILTDSLPEGFRTNGAYLSKYQITLERMKLTRPHSMLNPCPPFFSQ